MWKRIATKFIAGVAGCLVLGAVHASTLVVNGTFEDPVLPPGTATLVNSLAGWTVHTNGVVVRNQSEGQAYEGRNFIQLVGAGPSSIWQQVGTVVGRVYELSFAYAPHLGVPVDGNGVSVYWNDTLVATIARDGTGGSTWTRYLLSVVGTGRDVLTFAANGNGAGAGLDGVQLSPVPLPGAAVLFGTVALGYWGAQRRRATPSPQQALPA